MKKEIRIMSLDEISYYDVKKTMKNVKNYFSKYRNYQSKIYLIQQYNSCSLGNDNLGIFSSNISDPTANKVEKYERQLNYVNQMDAYLKNLKKNLTEDEKVILQFSILDCKTDEVIAEIISVAIQNFYQRKKSCYIKVACYFDLEVEKE